jgi:hypothetical protein
MTRYIFVFGVSVLWCMAISVTLVVALLLTADVVINPASKPLSALPEEQAMTASPGMSDR